MKHDIIVFLGPSITKAEAQKILPDATYLPPISCGDILRVLRLNPKIIAIIDGFFENTAAVWHKEILWAMEQGVRVYGASSMGALRAAELADFGMVGVGKVFNDYYHSIITDDDEVSVFHQPEVSNFSPISDAMVNIRATVSAALQQKIIDTHLADKILSAAKSLHYSKRTLMAALEKMPNNTDNFLQWLQEGNFINQKHADAIELLQLLAAINTDELMPAFDATVTNPSLYLRTVQRNVMARPFHRDYEWLPTEERIALQARLLDKTYLLNRYLAYLLGTADALARHYKIEIEKPKEYVIQNASCCCDSNIINNDLRFKRRLSSIDQLLQRVDEGLIAELPSIEEYQLYARILVNLNDETISNDKIANRTIRIIAKLWRLVDWHAKQRYLELNIDKLQLFANDFRLERQLMTEEATYTWMKEHDMDGSRFEKMLRAMCRLDHFVIKTNLDPLAIRCDNRVWWLWDALRLTGAAKLAETFLNSHLERNAAIKRLQACYPEKLDEYLYQLDFLGGEAELQEQTRIRPNSGTQN